MFIAYIKNNNKQFVENSSYKNRFFTWDDIPQDVNITALTLTHPLSSDINGKRISPKVSINKYHYYYFFNEATISLIPYTNNEFKHEKPALVAKVMAGVDVERKYVLEIRLDKFGNTSINSYPLQALIKKFDNGHMRKTILKPGLNCAKEKRLL